ncbi:Catalyzes methyl transfer from S-methylmethionine (SMM) to adenosyl-L-homocysteine (AdoMet) [Stylosanthes scabra]|uniref:Catalyzes methyl transfer from S-methylmethionine (SMM) to adenosyl-L-homocysteine (AdoMet) n=1 Tax=Stylosanthes scabra TaxID=79078 RepID=A0ABU6X7N6_9FABA|nr:Catalyzes methyl transfer from S-methylmethionine (SMM) to adenosyl-L-homocysteine (AdoMet) [Stylosanthes scabra]
MGLEGSYTSSFMRDFLDKCASYGGCAVVDGGFATELERHGADLNDPLWSAKCLISSPHLVRRVHLDYLDAGANIIITASYQATIQGFEAKGLSREEGKALLRRSVELAREARQVYYDRCTKDSSDFLSDDRYWKRPILVAASVGSYGAYLADGSEYRGDYGDAVTVETLKDFHRERVKILVDSGADLIAFETIPNKLEAQAYAELLDEEEGIHIPAWFSFSCKDESHVVNGDPIQDCAVIADSCSKVVAVGVNCTAPRFIHGLISSIKKATSKAIIVYPNSGETYIAETHQWEKSSGVVEDDFVSYVGKWREAGASVFGGCCRTTPNTIRGISQAIRAKQLQPQ